MVVLAVPAVFARFQQLKIVVWTGDEASNDVRRDGWGAEVLFVLDGHGDGLLFENFVARLAEHQLAAFENLLDVTMDVKTLKDAAERFFGFHHVVSDLERFERVLVGLCDLALQHTLRFLEHQVDLRL